MNENVHDRKYSIFMCINSTQTLLQRNVLTIKRNISRSRLILFGKKLPTSNSNLCFLPY